jgi:hypothetical protein
MKLQTLWPIPEDIESNHYLPDLMDNDGNIVNLVDKDKVVDVDMNLGKVQTHLAEDEAIDAKPADDNDIPPLDIPLDVRQFTL